MRADSAPSGTVTFMFTDIEGSTRLWEAMPDEMRVALARHDDIVRSTVDRHGGYVFGAEGDGFAVAFHRASDAAHAVREITEALAGAPDSGATIRVRIGLHVGEAHERDGDYFGPAVNRAARIGSVAHGGQAVVSSTFAALFDEAPLIDLGEHLLRDIEEPEHLWQLGDGTFPPLRSRQGYRHNLPPERTELFGRTADIESVVQLIDRHRLVALLGIGGTGKTRLAIAAASEVVHRFSDGVWFVDLVTATSADQVVGAIAAATALHLTGPDLVGRLAHALAHRDLLLVLDNCEAVTDRVAVVAEALLAATSGTRILVTSREPLGLPDECHFQVPALSVSAEPTSPAVELFASAAERAGRAIGPDDVPLVAHIARNLDGLPLSIELAAAQLRQLTLDELAERLDRRFEILTSGRGGAGHRQESLHAVLDGTWALLDDEEKRLLLHLAAFPSTFGLPDVEGLTAGRGVGVPANTLSRLAERGLVTHDGTGRHHLSETVKLFGRRRWAEEVDPEAFAERHVEWFLDELRSYTREEWYTSYPLTSWANAHYDDRYVVENRLAAASRTSDLAVLYAANTFTMWNATGVRAITLLDRIEGHLAAHGGDPALVAVLHLAAASAALPARRPDWFERGSTVAIEHFRHRGEPEAFASALIAGSLMPALRDVDLSLIRLVEASEVAYAGGHEALGALAASYTALVLAVSGKRDQARSMLPDVEARLDPERVDYATNVRNSLVFVLDVIDDPDRAIEAMRAAAAIAPYVWWWALCESCAAAATGDVHAVRAAVAETEARVRGFASDDGLPDLLLPLAILAWRVGDTERGARWVTAIRRAPRLTTNFMITGAYRQLRDRVGLLDDSPLESASVLDVYLDAKRWLDELVRSEPS